jgi:hypothetical protein
MGKAIDIHHKILNKSTVTINLEQSSAFSLQSNSLFINR